MIKDSFPFCFLDIIGGVYPAGSSHLLSANGPTSSYPARCAAPMAHNYDVGTKAWQPDATEGWVASEVISRTEDDGKVTLVFELANGEVCAKFIQISSDHEDIY